MGRMLDRVMGLAGVLLIALAVPSAASAAPNGQVAGWRTPAGGSMDLWVQATPDPITGAALRTATATIGDLEVTESFVDGTCSLTCPAIVVLPIDTGAKTQTEPIRPLVPDGPQTLVVTIEDETGARREILDETLTVDNKPVESRSSVSIQIGSGEISPPGSPPGGPGGGGEGPSCRSPQLSMRLGQKPLRYRRGVPVVKRGRVYRYEGRLTCRINGARRPAPPGMPVQVRNRLRGGWTVVKPTIHVRKAGEVVARLAYTSRRTIIFRVRGAGGELVRVRIPIRVARR